MAIKSERYTTELADEIFRRLADGESLRAICRDAHMPSASTVRDWILADDEFAGQYARARDKGLDAMAEEIIQIANTPVEGIKVTEKATGTEITRGDMIEHRRLQVDARKWYLSKLAPKRYGDRLEIDGKLEVDVASTIVAARKRAGA